MNPYSDDPERDPDPYDEAPARRLPTPFHPDLNDEPKKPEPYDP